LDFKSTNIVKFEAHDYCQSNKNVIGVKFYRKLSESTWRNHQKRILLAWFDVIVKISVRSSWKKNAYNYKYDTYKTYMSRSSYYIIILYHIISYYDSHIDNSNKISLWNNLKEKFNTEIFARTMIRKSAYNRKKKIILMYWIVHHNHLMPIQSKSGIYKQN